MRECPGDLSQDESSCGVKELTDATTLIQVESVGGSPLGIQRERFRARLAELQVMIAAA